MREQLENDGFDFRPSQSPRILRADSYPKILVTSLVTDFTPQKNGREELGNLPYQENLGDLHF